MYPVCVCVLYTILYVAVLYIPSSPIPSSEAVSLSSWLSSAPSMLLALKMLTSSCSPSSQSQVCTSSSDQSATSSLEWPGKFLPAKHTTGKEEVLCYYCTPPSPATKLIWCKLTISPHTPQKKDTRCWYGVSDNYFPAHADPWASKEKEIKPRVGETSFCASMQLINLHMTLCEWAAAIYHARPK